jgi:hypothetical protein
MTLTVKVPGPTPEPTPVPFPLDLKGETPDGLSLVLTIGPEQQQKLWARLDGDRIILAPFALPAGRGTADASKVEGTMLTSQGQAGEGRFVSAEGTLTIGAPGRSNPGVVWTLTPR